MAEEPVVPVMISQLVSKFKELVKKVTYDKSEIDSKLNGKASNALVSSSNNGLMSSVDKTKLDGVASGANKTVVDSAMSSTSVNPVQNKVVKVELDSLNTTKANASHVHSRLVPTDIPENADLNDYTTQGSFYCPLNATAVTVDNTPSNQAFHLEVYKTTSDSSKGVCQVAYSFHQDNVHSWWRNGYGGNWSEWYEVANKEDIASLNNNKANTNHTHNNYTATTTVTCNYGTVKKFKKNGWAVIVWQDINLTNISKDAWVTLADVGWTNQGGFDNHYGNFCTNDLTVPRFEVTQKGLLRAYMSSNCTNKVGNYGYIVYPTVD